jgi:16S rRNA (uracil1498-N3)-methyltransferase
MSAPLFLVEGLPEGDMVVLDGPEGHHAADVQRLRPGEELLIGDGRGTLCQAVVASVTKGRCSATITSRSYERPPSPRLVVVQAIAKGDRGELAVQAMTEIGVDVIVPWSASRSVTQWRDERGERARQRWCDTAREAAKQARRAWVPEVTAAESTRTVAARLAGGLVLHESASTSLSTVDLPADGDLVLVVGPEGGVAPEELSAFAEAGGRAVRLGPSVLRTSTAGMAALAVLSVRLGRW